jgi:hypothetical protein
MSPRPPAEATGIGFVSGGRLQLNRSVAQDGAPWAAQLNVNKFRSQIGHFAFKLFSKLPHSPVTKAHFSELVYDFRSGRSNEVDLALSVFMVCTWRRLGQGCLIPAACAATRTHALRMIERIGLFMGSYSWFFPSSSMRVTRKR